MKIGIPREIKRLENRVALIPDGVRLLRDAGHEIYIEKGAGLGAGFKDEDYTKEGAIIAGSHKEVFEVSDMVYKVKEPLPEEYGLLKEGQILYAFLHLAAAGELTRVLLEKKVTSVAFETVQFDNGHLPLLEPMSEVAGRLSVQEGAKYLESTYGGRGLLLGGVPGVSRAEVMILGAGTVGYNAAKIAYGMGARVCILDIDKERLKFIDDKFE
ncbi:MAG: alanine dehydrogenase, partial [Deltaproteobacteria bacterium]